MFKYLGTIFNFPKTNSLHKSSCIDSCSMLIKLYAQFNIIAASLTWRLRLINGAKT